MLAGKFERGGLAYVLKQIYDSRKSGELVCTHENGKRCFLVDGRSIVGFQSNYPEDDLANFLFQQHLLRKDEYDVLISRALDGHDTEDLIIHSEIVEVEVLKQQQTERIETALMACNAWPVGDYEFSPSPLVAFLPEALHVPLMVGMVKLLRLETPADALLEGLGGEGGTLRPAYKWQEMAAQLSLTPQEGFVLSRMTSPMTVHEILEIVPLPRQQVLPILHMFLVLGLVTHARAEKTPAAEAEPAASPATHAPEARKKEEPAEESGESLESLQERVLRMLEEQQNASHYQVLGVDENASAEQIRSAYHQLARQFHPDRFFGDAVSAELRRAVDDLFEKIRTAYETLRDDKSRSDYDRARISMRTVHSATPSVAPPEDRERMAEYSYRQGLQYYQQRDFFTAVQQFREAVRLQPEVAKFRAGLAKAMMRNPRWRKEAEENFKKAIELDEFNADHRVDLGRLYLEAGMPRKAEAQFMEALAWDADNRAALRELAKIEAQQRESSFLGKLFGGRKKKS